MHHLDRHSFRVSPWAVAWTVLVLSGCGTTLERGATEQLLASDAVDRAIAAVDFRDLAGEKVFFDSQYIKNAVGVGFVNSDYIISSLRQQLVASGCLLQDDLEDADYVLEGRVGTLGADRHELVYGIPANNGLQAASAVVPTAPLVPMIPELALAKRDDQLAAAKLGFFAYDRHTKEPVWQSGISQAKSTAKDSWFLGIGPFERGTIYRGTHLAGSKIGLPLSKDEESQARGLDSYAGEYHFKKLPKDDESQSESKTVTYVPQLTAPAATDEDSPGPQDHADAPLTVPLSEDPLPE